MPREIVQPGPGRRPLGPYSTAVKADGFVYTAGQIGWDADIEGIVDGGIEAETRKTLQNLQGVLEDAGVGMADVVKTTVFLADIGDWPAVNAVWAEVFAQAPPARSAVAVVDLPAGALVEVEAVAVVP